MTQVIARLLETIFYLFELHSVYHFGVLLALPLRAVEMLKISFKVAIKMAH